MSLRPTAGAALAVLAVLAVLATGCSGSDAGDSASTPSAPTSSSTTGADETALVTDQQLVDVATEAITRVVARDHETFDDDVATAVPLLTDDFGARLVQAADSVRASFVRDETTVSVEVRAAGVVSSIPGEAQVLVYLDETVSTADADPRTSPVAAVVGVTGAADDLRVDAVTTDLSEAGVNADPAWGEIERAARDFVTPPINASAATFAARVEQVRAFATGPLADDVEGAFAPLAELVPANGTSLSAVSGAVGFASVSETEADVLVAATVEVARAQADPVRETVRMRLTLRPVDGAWRVSALAFVV